MVFLSTSTANSCAVDLYLDFTGRNAGTVSFDVAEINNSTGDRTSKLQLFYTTDGSTFTEITGTSLPFSAVNNVASSASISVALPSALNNASSVRLRFYERSTTTGTIGSQPKISIDNVAVTSTASGNTAPVVTSSAATSITTTTATLNGNVTSDGGATVTERGFVYKTSAGATITDNKTTVSGTTGSYTLGLSSLGVNVQYFFKAYAINSIGTTLSTPELSFFTLANTPSAPTVGNATASTLDITIGSGDGNPSITAYAIKEAGGNYVQSGGALSSTTPFYQTATAWGTKTVTGLSPSTTYTFSVVATNGAGIATSFSATTSGTTIAGVTIPSVTTQAATSTNTSGATLNGTVMVDGGASLTDRGFYWTNTAGVTTSGTKLSEGGTSVAAFSKALAGLSPNTNIFYRAYAVNSSGTGIGASDVSFYTLANTPSAPTVSGATPNSLNVAITAGDGNPANTAYAIQETTSGNYVTNVIGALGATAVYKTASSWGTATVTRLSASTIYTFAVVATNGAGIATAPGSTASGNTQVAPLAGWDFFGNLGSEATVGATVFNLNLNNSGTLTNITRGAGAAGSAAGNSFRTTGFKNDGISTANTDYFQATLAAATGYTLSLGTIDARLAGTSSFSQSPGVSMQYAYSLDGTTFTLIGSPLVQIGDGPMTQIDVSGIGALQNVPSTTTVTIRYYASGQTATGGWGFNSPFLGAYGLRFGGTVNVIAAPSAPVASAATGVAANGFSANWSTAVGAASYRLDVSTDAGFGSFVSGYNDLNVGNVTTYPVSGLSANTGYHFRVRAVNGGGTSGNSSTIDVTTLANTPKILVTLPGQTGPNTGSATAQTAGTGFDITLTATTDGTTMDTSFNSTPNITFSGPTGSPSYPSTVSFSSGVGTAHITLAKAETTTITATDTSDPIAGTASSSLTVNPGTINSYVVAASSPQIVGVAFPVAVTAKDVNNNTVTTDSSTLVTMGSGSGNVTFTGSSTLAAGTFTVSATDNTAETTTINATDGNGKTGTTGSIVVNPTPNYRSKQSGNWSDFTTWQVDTGSGFADAVTGQTPTYADGTVEIQNGHTVTVAALVTVDQVTVDSGGSINVASGQTLTVAAGAGTDLDVSGTVNNAGTITPTGTIVFESGGKYQHNFTTTAGTIPAATWNTGATCEIIGYTSDATAPSGLGQAFYNFIWNCSSQTSIFNLAGTLTTVNGNLIIQNSGTGSVSINQSTAGSFTVNVLGDLILSGGSFSLQGSGSGSRATTLNLGGNFNQTSGFFTNGIGGSSANTLNFTGGSASVTLTESGGTYDWQKMNTAIASGKTLTLNSDLNMGTVVSRTFTVSGTLDPSSHTISGSPTLTIASGGTLKGTGTASVHAVVSSGGTLSPGSSSIATLTFGSGLTLAGTAAMDINKSGVTLTTDNAAVTGTLAYGGTLTVTAGGDALVLGDSFTPFTAGTFSGWFSTVTLPTLAPGLSWDTNNLATTGVLDIYTFTTTPLALSTPVGTAAVISSTKLANHAASSRGTPVAVAATLPSHGSASVDGSGNLTYTPTDGFGSDSFTVTFQDGHGTQTMAVSVTVGSGTGQSPNVVFGPTTDGNGNFVVRFAGIPGTTYTVEKTTSLTPPSWIKLGNYMAPSDNSLSFGVGVFQVSDPVANGSGYYRTVYPSH